MPISRGSSSSLPKKPSFASNSMPGGSNTDCAASTVSLTCRDRHCIFFGSGVSVPSIHSTWSPLLTFHSPGPGSSPLTTTAGRFLAAVVAGAGAT